MRTVSRAPILAITMFLVLTTSTLSAQADEVVGGSDGTIDSDDDGGLTVDVGTDVVEAVEGSGAGSSSPYVWVPIPVPGSSGDPDDGNTGACRATTWIQALPEEAEQIRQDAEQAYLDRYQLIPDLMGLDPNVPCPVDPADELPAAVVEDTIRAVVTDQLPRPTLDLPPGFALTGLRTYLITDHELTHDLTTTVDLQIAQIDVSISATGTSVVDWGDGTVTEHEHGSDSGHPDGPINHVYTHADTVDISVTDTWTVTFQAGPISGTFDAPLAAVVLDGIEVQERRAVRTS